MIKHHTMSNRSFTDLDVYKECRKFRKEVSKMIKVHFPKVEKYLLTAQLLDSSRSITGKYCRRTWTLLLFRKCKVLSI